jgi:hypothetical protein
MLFMKRGNCFGYNDSKPSVKKMGYHAKAYTGAYTAQQDRRCYENRDNLCHACEYAEAARFEKDAV